jgi:5-methylcytosine-specific restriction endonuclease McrA
VRRVLLLNVTYEPLTTVGLRRAVCLVLGEKAEIVHHDTGGKRIHSARVEVVTPSVIRLRRYVRIPQRNRVPLTRAALMRRDNYKCAYCGRHGETIDHVHPRSRGGQHTWENCVAACQMCNHRKADRLLSELGWTLPVAPAVPKGAHWRLIGAQFDGDPQWEAYLGAAAALRLLLVGWRGRAGVPARSPGTGTVPSGDTPDPGPDRPPERAPAHPVRFCSPRPGTERRRRPFNGLALA